MKVIGPHYIGERVSIANLRNWILDLDMTEADTILLHPHDFDNIVLEYRETYSAAMPEPYYILSTPIEEAVNFNVPRGQIVMLQEDDRPARQAIQESSEADDYRTIFRCGWCGNVVDEDGCLLDDATRSKLIAWLQQRAGNGDVRAVNGKCCPNGHG